MTTIEPLSATHFELVASWLADSEINRWLTSDWRGRAVTGIVVAMAVKNRRNQLCLVRYDDSPCGLVALSDIDSGDHTAMIWYLLGEKSMRGRSITPDAVRLLAAQAFNTLQLRTLYAWIMDDNHASRRTLEKAGFKVAGRIRSAARSGDFQVDRTYFDLISEEVAL